MDRFARSGGIAVLAMTGPDQRKVYRHCGGTVKEKMPKKRWQTPRFVL